MASTKVSDLTAITTPTGADLIYVVSGGNSRQVSLTNLMAQADDINTNLVTLTGTQTLTNKTLTSPTINTPTITNPTVSTGAFTSPVFATSADLNGVELFGCRC